MPLFATIQEVKTHLGGAVSASVKIESITPFFETAVSNYISPKIGEETVTILRGGNLTGVKLAAQGLMKSAVAWFAIYEYSTVGNVQFTEGGIQRSESDSLKSAFKYQENSYRRTALKNAWSNVELLLQLLLDKPSEFTEYHASVEKALNNAYLLNFTTDFAKARCRTPERYTYEALLPYVADVDTFCIMDFLGDALYSRLKTKQYVKEDIGWTNEQKATFQKEQQLIAYLRKGIAEMVYHLATIGNLIEYTGNRVITRETYLNDDVNKTANPPTDVFTATYNQRREWADKYFRLAECYITDHKTTFEEWIGFIPTPEPPATTQNDSNNRLKSL